MGPEKRRMLSFILTAAATVSCSQPALSENTSVVNYAKFTVHVNGNSAHKEYKVSNGILLDNSGRLYALRFCDSRTRSVLEVPIADTDYFEKDKTITPEEEKGNVSAKPFNTAKPGEKPCELLTSDGTIIEALGFGE